MIRSARSPPRSPVRDVLITVKPSKRPDWVSGLKVGDFRQKCGLTIAIRRGIRSAVLHKLLELNLDWSMILGPADGPLVDLGSDGTINQVAISLGPLTQSVQLVGFLHCVRAEFDAPGRLLRDEFDEVTALINVIAAADDCLTRKTERALR